MPFRTIFDDVFALWATITAVVFGLVAGIMLVAISWWWPRSAGPNPCRAHTLERATSSPPPTDTFSPRWPLPPVRSYTPLLDLRAEQDRLHAEIG